MKTDKILFAAACVGMGFILNATIDKSNCESIRTQRPNSALLGDVKLQQGLKNDTVYLSNAVKSDTLNILKKIK